MSVIPEQSLSSAPPSPPRTSSVLPSFSRSPHSHSVPPPSPYDAPPPPSPPPKSTLEPLMHLHNCRIASDTGVSPPTSLWLDPASGRIVGAQEAFFSAQDKSREVTEIDMGGDVVAPGYIDVQINGAYGYDFSDLPPSDEFPTVEAQDREYVRRLEFVASRLVETGVTSFVPTIISQTPDLYQRLLPLLNHHRFSNGASSLGFHAEGPFLSPGKPGCHPPTNLLTCEGGWKTFERVYGRGVLDSSDDGEGGLKMFTVAPEVKGVLKAVEEVKRRGGMVCVGHSDATGVQAMAAVLAGATMITHLYNAMPQLHHRDTGIIGLIGSPSHIPPPLLASVRKLHPDPISHLVSRPASPRPHHLPSVLAPASTPTPPDGAILNDTAAHSVSSASNASDFGSEEVMSPVSGVGDHIMGSEEGPRFQRPFWGIIVDGIHVHPNAVRLAYQAFPEGCVLVTDCVFLMDPTASNGLYPFRPPQKVLREGLSITLEGTSTLAGSAIDMATSVRNLSAFASIPMWKAIACCTTNAAKALGGRWAERKGRLEKGWDGDMVVLDGKGEVKATWVRGREVWKRKE